MEEKYGGEVWQLPFDVRARAALDSLPEEWKAVDVLVNNAGLAIGVDKEHEGSLDEWGVVIGTDVKALSAMTRHENKSHYMTLYDGLFCKDSRRSRPRVSRHAENGKSVG